MRAVFLLTALILTVSSCSEGPHDRVLLVEDTLLDVHEFVSPGSSPREVRARITGPGGFIASTETVAGEPAELRLPTTLYDHPATATFAFDGGGLYRIRVALRDLGTVQAEEFRERVETYQAGVFPAGAPDPRTGWERELHGVEFSKEGGSMATGWDLMSPDVGTVTFLAGVPDGFQAPADPTNRNSEIADYIRSHWLGQDVRDFDTPGNDLAVVHRFTDLPDGPYCSAQLILRLRGQTSSLSENDSIRLIFPVAGEGSEPFAWWRPIRAFTGTWGVGRDISLEVDLDHLPVDTDGETSVLNRITGNVLDVVVEDDTAVDFMLLRIRTPGHRGHGVCGAS